MASMSYHSKTEKFWKQTTAEIFIQAKHKIIFISYLRADINTKLLSSEIGL